MKDIIMGIWRWANSLFQYWLHGNQKDTPVPEAMGGLRTASAPLTVRASEDSVIVEIHRSTPSYEALSPRLSVEAFAELMRESAQK